MAKSQEPSKQRAADSTHQPPIVVPCGADDEIELRIVVELKRKPSDTKNLRNLVLHSVEGGSHGGKPPGTLEAGLSEEDIEALS